MKRNHIAVAKQSNVHLERLPHAFFGHLGFVDWNFAVLFIDMWSEGKQEEEKEDIENAIETARGKGGACELSLDNATHIVHFLTLHNDRSTILPIQLQRKGRRRFLVYKLGEDGRSLSDEVLPIEDDLDNHSIHSLQPSSRRHPRPHHTRGSEVVGWTRNGSLGECV